MKSIELTAESKALVDDDDYQILSLMIWRLDKDGYAIRNTPRKNGIRGSESMHRRIMGLNKGDPRTVDHIDGNKLNNQKYNLRICTIAENSRNCALRKDNKIGFKGVKFHKGKFQADIKVNGKGKYLGRFDTPEEAHEVYCLAADLLHGEFANYGG